MRAVDSLMVAAGEVAAETQGAIEQNGIPLPSKPEALIVGVAFVALTAVARKAVNAERPWADYLPFRHDKSAGGSSPEQ